MRGARGGGVALVTLLALLPFEPRTGLGVLGFQLTLLEAVAGIVIAATLWTGRGSLAALVRHPPVPLACFSAFVAALLLSAALAPGNRGLALRFCLRMAAAAALALAVCLADGRSRQRALDAFIASGAAVALLCVAEGLGVDSLTPLLDGFRQSAFHVEGVRRATGGSEYPTLAAALLMAALLAAAGACAARPSSRRLALLAGLSPLIAAGLVFTLARAALMAAAGGLLVLALACVARRRVARAPLLALGALVSVTAASAALRPPVAANLLRDHGLSLAASAPLPAAGALWAYQPTRSDLWRRAWLMWRERPLLGTGPDNFRWRHHLYAQDVPAQPWLFANSLYFETAANAGLLGLAFLAATLCACGWRAAHVLGGRAPGLAAPVLALTAGFALHGAVEYTLAFTGHYLLFGYVVGAASTLGVERGARGGGAAGGELGDARCGTPVERPHQAQRRQSQPA